MPKTKFLGLKKVFCVLHGKNGCLWDKQQTHRSILGDLEEEVEEFSEAVRREDYDNMREELGDLLLHVMFHSQIAAKRGKFDIEDVIDTLIRKLKRRHPHVFSTVKVGSTKEIIQNWNAIKKQEKRCSSKRR